MLPLLLMLGWYTLVWKFTCSMTQDLGEKHVCSRSWLAPSELCCLYAGWATHRPAFMASQGAQAIAARQQLTSEGSCFVAKPATWMAQHPVPLRPACYCNSA